MQVTNRSASCFLIIPFIFSG